MTQQDDAEAALPASQWGSTAYTYDALNRVQTINQTISAPATPGNNPRGAVYTYYNDGRVNTVQRYDGPPGTPGSTLVSTSTYTYDAKIGRLTRLLHTNAAGGILAEYDYFYDAAGRMTRMDILGEGASGLSYDATNQLTGATVTAESYTYDANGNRTSFASGGAAAAGVTTSGDNQLQDDGTFTYTYDNAGDRLTRTRKSTAAAADYLTQYTWDNRYRLTGVTLKNNSGVATFTAQYVYDAQDRRIKTVVDSDGAGPGTPVTTYAIYQGREVVLEFTDADLNNAPAAVATHRYFWAPGSDELLLDRDPSGASGGGGDHWTLADHEQSIRDVVDNAGVKQEHRKYDSFGNILTLTDGAGIAKPLSALLTAYAYTGQRYNAQTGLLDYHARSYDPRNGIFISEDPLGFASGDYNPYPYVRNNPLTNDDPTGLCRNWPGNTKLDLTPDWTGFPTTLDLNKSTSGYIPTQHLLSNTSQNAEIPKWNPDNGPQIGALRPGAPQFPGPDVGSDLAWAMRKQAEGARIDRKWQKEIQNYNDRAATWQQQQDQAKYLKDTYDNSLSSNVLKALDLAFNPAWNGQGNINDLALAAGGFAVSAPPTKVELPPSFTGRTSSSLPSGIDIEPPTLPQYGTRTLARTNLAENTAVRATGDTYSVAFQTELKATSYPGVSRGLHFQEANENLLQAMESDPQFAQTMQNVGVNLQRTPTGLAPRTPLAGWTWHHVEDPGVLQLVPRVQHTPGSIFWDTLHPDGQGGYAIWGK